MSSLLEISGQRAILVVEPILPLAELEATADERDLRSTEGFTSASRRAERLAWRRVLRRISPDAEVEYNASGAPLLKNSPYTHISVSHCRDVVAVALSCAPCGVDVELRERNFERVAERYISQAERALCAEAWWLAAVWCAKECLYKMGGREGVDFRRDIIIEGVNAESQQILCRGVDGAAVTLKYALPDETHIVVYAL